MVTRLEIEGLGTVEVGDAFTSLSPEEQAAEVDAIVQSQQAATAGPGAALGDVQQPPMDMSGDVGLFEGPISNLAARGDRLDVQGGQPTVRVPGQLAGAAREFAEGATLNFAGEIEAGLRAPFSDRTFDEILQEIDQQQAAFREADPALATTANIAGALTTAIIPAGAVARAATATGRALRGVGAGGTIGAISGFGGAQGGLEERAAGAQTGAAVGGIIGGAAPGVARGFADTLRLFRARARNARTLDELAETARIGFQSVENAGIGLRPEAALNFIQRIPRSVLDDIDPGLSPKATRAFQRLRNVAQTGFADAMGRAQAPTLSAFIRERMVLNRVIRSTTDDFDRMALIGVRNQLDEFIDNIAPSQLARGVTTRQAQRAVATFRAANTSWRRFRRGETIVAALTRAQENATRTRGIEPAIRQEFRRLIRNKREFQLFSKREQAAIRQAARRGVVTGPLAGLASFAPSGFFSIGIPGLAAVGGAPAALALPAVGVAARGLAGPLARRQVQEAFEAAAGVQTPALQRGAREGLTAVGLAGAATDPVPAGR